jgi:hypothetical protein
MRLRPSIALGIAVVSIVACSKKEEASGDGGPASKESTAAAEVPLNPTLVAHVNAHAEKCTVNVEGGQAYSCKDNITDAMSKYMRETKPADFAATLIALIRKTSDAKVSAAAVALFSEQWDYLGDEGKKKNARPAVVKEAIAALKENAGNRAARLAGPVTHLATLAGSFDELYVVADSHASKEARGNVYRNLLVFGSLKALPKLKEVAEKEPNYTVPALDAATRLGSTATDEEKGAVCPWAEGYLKHKDLNVAAEAGQAMVFCKGKYVDSLLAEAETRLKNKEYKDPFAMGMREPCFEFITDITKKAASEKQCDAVYTFLEKAANDATVDDSTRGLALWNIYYQRRDDKTLKLMRKYEKSPNKEIAKRAKEAIDSLTTTYKLKG